jgi:hypothetical protein
MRLSCDAAIRKSAEEAIVNIHAKRRSSRPAGKARAAVRGFAASISRSAIRLKVIAADRAPTIATVIQMSFEIQKLAVWGGMLRAASAAPKKAKGSANSVCSILIISSVIRSRSVIVILDFTTGILAMREKVSKNRPEPFKVKRSAERAQ